MKEYTLKKSIILLPITLILILLIGLGTCLLLFDITYQKNIEFVYFMTISLLIFALFLSLRLRFEKIIIEDNQLIYKKMFKKQSVSWANIAELNINYSWDTKSKLVLKGNNISLNVDFHSFDNSKELLNNILSHLRHITIHKTCEFTEV